MQILIVEDDLISRMMLKKIIEEMGHSVIMAENGEEAMALFNSHPIQITITDWVMPKMDGLELCRTIRSHSQDRYIYIIILTAKDNKQDLIEVFEAGADDYVTKPFDPEELRARVQTSERIINLEESYKYLQNVLIESRNKVRIVFDSLYEEIFAVDQHRKLVSANRRFVKRIGGTYEELTDGIFSLDSIVNTHRLYDPKIFHMVAQVFDGAVAQKSLDVSVDHHGQTIYKQITCLPVTDDADRVIQAVIVSKDITEERRKSEEINSLNKQLIESAAQIEAKNKTLQQTIKRLEDTQSQMIQSEKMASIGQLAAGVAHEINNPTGFVSSNLKTLEDYLKDMQALIGAYRQLVSFIANGNVKPPLSGNLQELVQSIQAREKDIDIDFIQEDIADLINDCREGTERIKKIVIDLKDFAHPGEDKLKTTDINKGIASTLNVVYNELKYKATLVKDLGDLPLVKCYPQQLNQVFMNILVNAAQAIEKSGQITIKTRFVDPNVEIILSDTGCGIPEENLSKIFDPFFTTKDVGKGTGLGMNIAYNIIKKHGGTIEVESQVGVGTTFTIRLPADQDV
jgi:two-component system NtrC family sensor kinase